MRQGDAKPSYASVSAHGNYETRAFKDVPVLTRGGVDARVVYHKDGFLTHSFRFAHGDETRGETWSDGGWDKPALVS
ncbi:NPP1 family protein [Streptomyces sp. NPDC002787]